MSKGKKIVLSIVVITAAIVSLVIVKLASGYGEQFADITREYDNIYTERIKNFENENVLRCYQINENVGFIVLGQGYEDAILLFAELSSDSVENVEILYHNETEDHGGFAVEDWFLSRLYMPYDTRLITVRNIKENANEVIAITGATITSDAVVNAINECADIMEEIKGE